MTYEKKATSLVTQYKLNNPSEGLYQFATDNKINYTIIFNDLTCLFPSIEERGMQAFDFSFYPTDKTDKDKRAELKDKFDPKIQPTIQHTINIFFLERKDILLFVADSSDSKHGARFRLFGMWYDETKLKESVYRYKGKLVPQDKEDPTILYSFFIRYDIDGFKEICKTMILGVKELENDKI